jgi:hypothetical protein
MASRNLARPKGGSDISRIVRRRCPVCGEIREMYTRATTCSLRCAAKKKGRAFYLRIAAKSAATRKRHAWERLAAKYPGVPPAVMQQLQRDVYNWAHQTGRRTGFSDGFTQGYDAAVKDLTTRRSA